MSLDSAPRAPFALGGHAPPGLYRLLAAVMIGLALALASDVFLTWGNLLNVARQTSLLFLIASGLTLVILTAGLDLSVGANVALSACLAASVIKSFDAPWLGVAVGVGCGSLVGFLNGALVTLLRIPSFIATYGTMWILTGMTYYYMGGETIHGFPPGFRQFGVGYLFGIPIPVYVMLFSLRLARSSRNARCGAGRSTRSAPIRRQRACPGCRSNGAFYSSTASAARWRGSPR